MNHGFIFDVKRYAINDGPGIRTAVFFKGCPLECWWCHNPEGQSPNPQLMYRQNRCNASRACIDACPRGAVRWENGSITDWELCDQCGECAEACFAGAREMVGREISPSGLMAEISRDVPFYDQSGGGVTFTGGEPMAQIDFLVDVLGLCKEQQIHTTVDTSGNSSWEKFSLILPIVDLFLYDLKLIDPVQHRKYTSVSNELILRNLKKLSEIEAHLIIRIPLIPGINDDAENIEQSASFMAALPTLDGVEIMPYHDIGKAKFEALGMIYKLPDTKSPSREKVEAVEQLFSTYHLPVIKHNGRSE
jgi:pyruvate formate lyase activating enzyme